jgi:hypothetical protein
VESFYELGSGPDQSRFFSPSLMKASQFYRFPITPHDPTPGPIQVFINVYQDVSLIHVIRLQLRIEE